jgi:chromate reductase
MPSILAFSGSLRAKSFNTILLHAAVGATPAGTTVTVGSIEDIPGFAAFVAKQRG